MLQLPWILISLWSVPNVVVSRTTTQSSALEKLTNCAVQTEHGVINLRPITARLEAQLGMWNYSFSPCYPFTEPEDLEAGFGDKCIATAMCKYGRQGRRTYFYNLGFDSHAEFVLDGQDNDTTLSIVYTGYWSMRGKKSYVRCVCDRDRREPGDAVFIVHKDLKFSEDRTTLGNVYAELQHVTCCPDGYQLTPMYSDEQHGNNTDTDVSPKEKDSKASVDRIKMMIIVGVNVAVILMAACVGFMCYTKRSHLEIYSKLPGAAVTADPKLWQLANSGDIEDAVTAGPISMVSLNKVGKAESKRVSFRDCAPQRRKSMCFPVLDHVSIPEQQIALGQRLGGGIFGDTYVGEWTGIKVSVKRITLSVHENQINTENIRDTQEQVAFLSQQRHRNIVSMLGHCSESKYPYIVSEFINGQIVKDFIKHAGTQLLWTHRVKMLSQLADGMAFLHSTNPPILHRDLRCGNLFITSNDVIKICDFGIVNLLQPLRACCQKPDCCCQGLYSACPPSISWTAPEVLENPNCDENDDIITTASDVFSCGILMWELVMCEDPYEDMNVVQEVIDYVVSGGRPEIPNVNTMFKPYLQLMKKCWAETPTERPSFKQVSVRLKEVLYQAKVFQKVLAHKSARNSSGTSQ